jgi:hypothetical protein
VVDVSIFSWPFLISALNMAAFPISDLRWLISAFSFQLSAFSFEVDDLLEVCDKLSRKITAFSRSL